VIGEKDSKASSLHRTQGAALEAARPIAQANRSELVIHGRDNKIVDRTPSGRTPILRGTRNTRRLRARVTKVLKTHRSSTNVKETSP
jgi:hypothetical protein